MADISDYTGEEDWGDIEDGSKTPEGEYRFKIEDVTVEQNSENSKDPDGSHFLFELTITAPTYEGSKEWHRITKENQNDKAVEIGKQQFKQMYLACGFDQPPSDTAEFLEEYIQGEVYHDDNGYTNFANPREDLGEPDGPDDSGGSSSSGDDSFDDDDIPF